MKSRREFIRMTAAGGVLAPMSGFAAGKKLFENKPIVISTWNFGVQANVEAWKILSKGGRSLDAVEAGARVPEGDPKETSVGLVVCRIAMDM